MARILVVDDDPPTRQVLIDALEDDGHTAISCADGRAALEYLASCGARQPDAIVLDLYMPAVDGREVAAAYHALPVPHAPIVVVSAALDARQQAGEMDAAAALIKPVDLEILLEQVRAALSGSAAGLDR